MKKFNFILPSRFPSEKAYSHQIDIFLNELASRNLFNVNLIFPKRNNGLINSKFDKKLYNKIEIGNYDYFAKYSNLFNQKIAFILSVIKFYFSLLKMRSSFHNSIIMTREVYIIIFFNLFKFIFKFDQSVIEFHQVKNFNFITNKIIMSTNYIYAISKNLKNYYLKYFLNVYLTHSSLTNEIIKINLLYKKKFLYKFNPKSKKIIGILGHSKTMNVSKGYQDILNEFLKKKYCDYFFIFAGLDKTELCDFKKLTQNNDNFILFGVLKNHNINKIYQIIDISIIHYNNQNTNQSPVKVIESLKYGIPIIFKQSEFDHDFLNINENYIQYDCISDLYLCIKKIFLNNNFLHMKSKNQFLFGKLNITKKVDSFLNDIS